MAQQITLTVHNASLSDVFKTIKKQSGYDFILPAVLNEKAHPVELVVKNAPLRTVLEKCFEGQPFTYVIDNKTIVVNERRASSGPDGTPAEQKRIDVSGKVYDEHSQALPGATIRVKGGTAITVANEEGFFLLQKVSPEDTLLISFTGYKTEEVHAAPDLHVIHMSVLAGRLNEVRIVNNGYQSLSAERAAGSFGKINSATLEKRNNYSITDYMEGQVAGLLLSKSGDITIRGQSTIYANKAPLLVVDGFPIERDPSTINPNDVESITVLKDAAAASIWGTRAANGVIVIQTKRGQSARSPLDISYHTSFSMSGKPDVNKLPYASVEDYMGYEKTRVDNGLVYFAGTPRPALSPVTDAYLHDPAGAAEVVDSLRRYRAYDEFSQRFMRPATRQQYGISLAGKGERTSTRASFNYDNLDTYMRQTGNDRFATDLFQSSNLSKKLQLETGLNYVVQRYTTDGLTLDDLKSLLPYQQIIGAGGVLVPQPLTFYQADKDALVQEGYPYNWDYNLFQEFRHRNIHAQYKSTTANAGLHYQLMKGLTANAAYQYEDFSNNTTQLQDEQTYYVRNLVNFSTVNKNGALVTGVPTGSIYTFSEARRQSQTFRGLLSYDDFIGSPKHQLTAIGGVEVRKVTQLTSAQTKYGYNPQTLQYANVDYTHGYSTVIGGIAYLPDGSVFTDTDNRFLSYFSNAGYTYDGKLSINGSARLDRTNVFGNNEKYRNVVLWSTGVSYQLHKTKFFASGIFNTLVLRATYGINGNIDKTTSPYLIAGTAKNAQTNLSYAYIVNPENPLLRWEKTKVKNAGIDYALEGGRIKGSVDVYDRYSSDLLGDATVNGTYGFSSDYINYASMRNTGVDLSLSALLLNRTFSIHTTLNYSYNKNRITHVDMPQNTVGFNTSGQPKDGRPLSYLESYRWAGLAANGTPQVYDAKHNPVGYLNPMTDPAALVYQGSGTPTHYGALYIDMGYKGFTLTSSFVYKLGYFFRTPQLQYQYLLAGSNTLLNSWVHRWQKPGDEARTNVPAMPSSQTGLNVYDAYTGFANINVANASSIRFQELLFNYALPAALVRKLHAGDIRIGVQARNLGIHVFNRQHIDPEYLTDNVSINLEPRPEYTFNIKANF